MSGKDDWAEMERLWLALPSYTWLPLEHYVEGRHAVFWFPHGDRGLGGFESASAYLEAVSWEDANPGIKPVMGYKAGWTMGGPNGGDDWEFPEPPMFFMKLEEPK